MSILLVVIIITRDAIHIYHANKNNFLECYYSVNITNLLVFDIHRAVCFIEKQNLWIFIKLKR